MRLLDVREDELRVLLEEGLRRHQVPGASVAVFDAGELMTAAAGVVNVKTGVELTPDAVMHIGSITKIVNATLMMQLVDEGKVDLDEPVVRYLPDLRLKDGEALAQITVKMLLNHTSGIDGEWLPFRDHDEETIEAAIRRFSDLDQLFAPGTEFSYCNAATVIAGHLVQRLRGKGWYELVKERVFAPLQMEQATATPEDALLHRASVGHFLAPSPHPQLARSSIAFLSLSFAPAGSTLMMSARDLLTFVRAHMSGGEGPNGARVLSARSVKAMQRITVDNQGKGYTFTDGIGIGWMVSENGLLSHSGGGAGVVSMLYVHPEREFAATVLVNADHGAKLIHELTAPWLEAIGIQRPVGILDVQAPAYAAKIDIDRYVGVYEDVVHRYRVSAAGHGLCISKQAKFIYSDNISVEEMPTIGLVSLGEDCFLLSSDKDDGRFTEAFRIVSFRNPDARGQMQHLGNSMRLYRRRAVTGNP